ncbi:MAG: hypothetical protein CVT92_02935 [Bacteroidetes bacterium HGW-Bacteroidetes-1]|jgi:hypothetical protein|nr:MAG: hypothetical protein CVT92_02935 [Bacteroidetes bacterium HGW-Bacteroidetes-1]
MKYVAIILFLTLGISISAQPLQHAAGIRGGVSSGLTYQYFYNPMEDVKLLLSFRDSGMQLSALMEHYESVMINYHDQFFMYYGAGLHLGYTRSYSTRYSLISSRPFETYPITRPVLGADAIVGLEYRVGVIPIAFGIDYKPFFEFFGNRFFKISVWDIAFSVKYQF